jgi:hypothetical protein
MQRSTFAPAWANGSKVISFSFWFCMGEKTLKTLLGFSDGELTLHAFVPMSRLWTIEDYLSWLIEIDRKTLCLTELDVRDLLIPTHNGEAMKATLPLEYQFPGARIYFYNLAFNSDSFGGRAACLSARGASIGSTRIFHRVGIFSGTWVLAALCSFWRARIALGNRWPRKSYNKKSRGNNVHKRPRKTPRASHKDPLIVAWRIANS